MKIALDADAGRVDAVPIWASVSQLRQLPRPLERLPHNQRIAPYELRTFHVIAVVREVLSEEDSDLHVILHDIEDPTMTMVAEIPDSSCALGSRHGSAFVEARRSLQQAPRDAIVVAFNAVADQPDHAMRAARAALAIRSGPIGWPGTMPAGRGSGSR